MIKGSERDMPKSLPEIYKYCLFELIALLQACSNSSSDMTDKISV